jgi:uncharacterized surface protein with fasciclin (FAS1) repeats
MFTTISKNIRFALLLFSFGAVVASCNKALETPAGTTPSTDLTLGDKVNTDPNYSIFKAALTRTGLLSTISTRNTSFTIFAPDNNAFIASGLSLATVNALPLTTLTPLIQYHIIPTNLLNGSGIVHPFPNLYMPSMLQIATISGLPIRMDIFPAKNGANYFVNNMPIVQIDAVTGVNGVMHRVPFIVQPPSSLMVKQLIASDANLTLFAAMVQRADVGQPAGLSRLDSVMNYAVANITVFAPNNTSIKGLINLLSGGAVPLGAPDATFIGFINANVPVATARGVVAYHMLGSRAFSVNLPLSTSTIETLIGPSPFPQLTVDRSTANPRLLGAANGAGNYSNFVAVDRLGVNGVLHVIDRVLLPQ